MPFITDTAPFMVNQLGVSMNLLRAQVGAQMVTDAVKEAVYLSSNTLDPKALSDYAASLSFSDFHAFNGSKEDYESDPEFAWLLRQPRSVPFELTGKACELQKVVMKQMAGEDISTNHYANYLAAFVDVVASLRELGVKPSRDEQLGSSSLVGDLLARALEVNQEWVKHADRIPMRFRGNPHIDKSWGVTVAGKVNGVFWRDSKNFSYTKAIAPGISVMGVQVSEFGTPLRASSIPHELGHAIYHNRVVSTNTPLAALKRLVSPTFHEIAATLAEIHLYGFRRQAMTHEAIIDRKVGAKVDVLMHAALRTDVENRLLDGSLEVKDLGEYWYEQIRIATGRDNLSYRYSWLSDMHFSMGLFGYYEAYGLAVLKAVEWFDQLPLIDRPHAGEAAKWLEGPFADFCLKHLNCGYQDTNTFSHIFPDAEQTLGSYKNWLYANHHL